MHPMTPADASEVFDGMPETAEATNDPVEMVECACCEMAEYCTPTYIEQTREVFHGRWVCGLCAEAVAEKMRRGPPGLTEEAALEAHMALSRSFNRTVRLNPKLAIALSMQGIARKISERRSTAAAAAGSKNECTRSISWVGRFDVCVEQSQSH